MSTPLDSPALAEPKRPVYRRWREDDEDGRLAPALDDPCWEHQVVGLERYLRERVEPATWDELRAWARRAGCSRSWLRQLLAYLSFKGRARCTDVADGCRWYATLPTLVAP